MTDNQKECPVCGWIGQHDCRNIVRAPDDRSDSLTSSSIEEILERKYLERTIKGLGLVDALKACIWKLQEMLPNEACEQEKGALRAVREYESMQLFNKYR